MAGATTVKAGDRSNLTVRFDRRTLDQMEEYRDPERFPTASDFIREAVRRMLQEERRSRTRERLRAVAREHPEQMEVSRQMAEAGFSEWAHRVWGGDEG